MATVARRRSPSPIVFLTVHGDMHHKLQALELGAIEYLQKPIHQREFALRIRNIAAGLTRASNTEVLARSAPRPWTPRRIGDLSLDPLRRRLSDACGNEIALTAAEFETLALLTAAPQVVVTRQEIAARLGPQSAARYNARIVDILIWRLRKKLCGGSTTDRFIKTLPSQGYMFVADVATEREAP